MIWVVKFTSKKNIFGLFLMETDSPVTAIESAVNSICHGNDEFDWEVFPFNEYYTVKLIGHMPIQEEIKGANHEV